MTLFIGESSTR